MRSCVFRSACRRFDTKNCTSHNGTVLSNGTCIKYGTVSDDEWNRIVAEGHNTKMASDEYFQ